MRTFSKKYYVKKQTVKKKYKNCFGAVKIFENFENFLPTVHRNFSVRLSFF